MLMSVLNTATNAHTPAWIRSLDTSACVKMDITRGMKVIRVRVRSTYSFILFGLIGTSRERDCSRILADEYGMNIPDYTFVHLPSPTKAGDVGAYVSRSMKFSENESLRLQIQGCEDLWFDVEIPGLKSKYVITVIYRHPRNSINTFIEALDENMQRLNNKKIKTLIMGDINIDLNSSEYTSSQSEYLNVLKSNGFSNLITKPTRVTATSQTTIDHILSNDYDSVLKPGVFSYKLADHYPIVCKISTPIDKSNNRDGMFMFRNNQAVDNTKFRDDLEAALIPLTYDLMQTTITPQLLKNSFKQLVYLITAIIEKHAPLQTASLKQKRIYKKPCMD